MKTLRGDVVIRRLDESRVAVAVDGVVRYVGTQEECELRAAILVPKNDRAAPGRSANPFGAREPLKQQQPRPLLSMAAGLDRVPGRNANPFGAREPLKQQQP